MIVCRPVVLWVMRPIVLAVAIRSGYKLKEYVLWCARWKKQLKIWKNYTWPVMTKYVLAAAFLLAFLSSRVLCRTVARTGKVPEHSWPPWICCRPPSTCRETEEKRRKSHGERDGPKETGAREKTPENPRHLPTACRWRRRRLPGPCTSPVPGCRSSPGLSGRASSRTSPGTWRRRRAWTQWAAWPDVRPARRTPGPWGNRTEWAPRRAPRPTAATSRRPPTRRRSPSTPVRGQKSVGVLGSLCPNQSFAR